MAAGLVRKKSILTNGGAPALDAILDISTSSESGCRIDYLIVGPDDTAAGRVLTAQLLDAAGAVLANLLPVAGLTLDNKQTPVVPGRSLATAQAGDDQLSVPGSLVLYPGDKLRVKSAALAQTETLTVRVRGQGSDLTLANTTGGAMGIVTTDA